MSRRRAAYLHCHAVDSLREEHVPVVAEQQAAGPRANLRRRRLLRIGDTTDAPPVHPVEVILDLQVEMQRDRPARRVHDALGKHAALDGAHAGYVEAAVHALAARPRRARLVALSRLVLRRLAVEAGTWATTVADEQSVAGRFTLVAHYLRAEHRGLDGHDQRVVLGAWRAVEARVAVDHLLVVGLPHVALLRQEVQQDTLDRSLAPAEALGLAHVQPARARELVDHHLRRILEIHTQRLDLEVDSYAVLLRHHLPQRTPKADQVEGGTLDLDDVAARLSDVHAISETSWTVPLIATLKDATEADGHRLWACAAHTRGTTKSGTAIFVRSTVKPCPGDGPLWAKPDGKALLAALTIQRQPIILLAAHLPHYDPERVAFLNEVADEVEKSVAAHVATPDGAPWRKALYLWAGDLNLTQHPTLDNEVYRAAPAPAVVQVLHRLNAVMDGAVDVYRALNPGGRAYTHGTVETEGSQRRLDAWFAAQRALSGPNGVVAARLVPRENAAFSYVNTHTRKECSKESDHDCVQIILRGTSIPRPKSRTTLRLSTLRHPDMRQAMSALIAEPDGQNPDETDTLWARIIDIGLSHQRRAAAARGKKRAEVLKRMNSLARAAAGERKKKGGARGGEVGPPL